MESEILNNFENIVSIILFEGFKWGVILLAVLLIFSLSMLGVGCLIKSQKIKSKFLKAVPVMIIGNVFFLAIPYVIVLCKNLI